MDINAGILLLTEDVVKTSAALRVGNNIIQASNGGSTITMDINDNVTIGGNLTVTGGDITLANGSTIDSSANAGILLLTEDVVKTSAAFESVDNATIGGNLTVNGTTTLVDPIITIGGNATNDAKDRGLEFKYHDGTNALIGFMGYDYNTSKFTMLTHATNNGSEKFTGTTGTLVANIEGGTVNATTLQIGGNSITSTAAELNTYILNVELSDISNASSCYVVVPKAGNIIKVSSIIDGTTGTSSTIDLYINNSNSSFGQILIPKITNNNEVPIKNSSSPNANNSVSPDDYIKISCDGSASNSVKAVFTIEIQY